MGNIRLTIRRLRMISGASYCWPTKSVRAPDFSNKAITKDLPEAVKQAKRPNEALVWETRRAGSRLDCGGQSLIQDRRGFQGAGGRERTTYTYVLAEREKVAGDLAADSVARKDLKVTYAALQKRGLRVAQEHVELW
jgi:hypothetical protein